MIGVLKILTPSVLKAIMNYVFEENELDQQMGSVRARLDNLEKDSHPPKGLHDLKGTKELLERFEKLENLLINRV